MINKIELHSGITDDYSCEWEELITIDDKGEKNLLSRITTCSDSPEDNTLSRIGSHEIEVVVELIKGNPQIVFERIYHNEPCDGILPI